MNGERIALGVGVAGGVFIVDVAVAVDELVIFPVGAYAPVALLLLIFRSGDARGARRCVGGHVGAIAFFTKIGFPNVIAATGTVEVASVVFIAKEIRFPCDAFPNDTDVADGETATVLCTARGIVFSCDGEVE